MEQRTFDELISNFNSTISKWEIELKYKFKLLGMISNIGYEHEKMLNNLPSAESETIYCKDCRKHNIGIGDFEETEQGRHWFWKGEACPLVQYRGKAQGHEYDYQYCAYAEPKER